jgi:hypothetical protein
MMLLTPFVALLSLPLFTSASPLAHKILAVSLSRRSTNQYLARQILEHDHARLAGFNARSSWKGKRAGKSASVPVTNVDMGYIASVTVGLTQKYNMAIDTGIGLTFVSVCSFFRSLPIDALYIPIDLGRRFHHIDRYQWLGFRAGFKHHAYEQYLLR